VDPDRYSAAVMAQVRSSLERDVNGDLNAFMQLWVHKEAVLKCTGDGLLSSPKKLSIDFREPYPTITSWSGHPVSDLAIRTIRIPGEYACAIAVATAEPLQINLQADNAIPTD
jgi:phosphopantetheinyl transferase